MARSTQIALVASRVLAALSLFFFAALRYGEPVWLVPRDVVLVALAFALALIIGLGLHALVMSRARRPKRILIHHGALTLVLALPLMGLFFAADLQISRLVLVYETAILFGLLLVNCSRLQNRLVIVTNLAIFAAAIAPSLTASYRSFTVMLAGYCCSVHFDDSIDYVLSSRHDLRVTTRHIFDDPAKPEGGGLVILDQDRLLVATGDGEFFIVSAPDKRGKREPRGPPDPPLASPLSRGRAAGRDCAWSSCRSPPG